ncbi:MAG: hypothetical protein BRC41_06085 [Cyanobacteria bacterium QH_9_48_43]|jgi:hypothetical protein|nr:MAG: hypothetical protein BRC35_00395 [Cyanobacteria bacterium QH_10_48_56]PSO63117.1 MAG: hypothetical protein BRC39_05140 [Cyanobacteria bacterium QH_7_48_89]PSO86785.1 MAG: hypothetical protein BRC41_06085 [Cyanobacteria bacterium QH_9_48_43]PSP09886.1 MAG: hypothetical protein BRC50_16420 [Cyanobacteria bacterium SW_11_48_12]PSP30339.1 MAG: hypothetical protein BRC59_03810 [Cyanobacteria bacterium SW_4_48_29]
MKSMKRPLKNGLLKLGYEVKVRKRSKSKMGDNLKVVFIHIPKCGGTSVVKGFNEYDNGNYFRVNSIATPLATKILTSQTAQLDETINNTDPDFGKNLHLLRSCLVYEAASEGKNFISGHVAFEERMEILKEMGYKLIVMLRNPVDHYFSYYFFNRYKETNHYKIDSDFDDFINSDRGQATGSIYIRYLAGKRKNYDSRSAEAIEQAKRNLSAFDIIGTIEDADVFKREIFEKLGIELNLPRSNTNPASKDLVTKYKQSEEYRKTIEEICRPNIELYEYARSQIITN